MERVWISLGSDPRARRGGHRPGDAPRRTSACTASSSACPATSRPVGRVHSRPSPARGVGGSTCTASASRPREPFGSIWATARRRRAAAGGPTRGSWRPRPTRSARRCPGPARRRGAGRGGRPPERRAQVGAAPVGVARPAHAAGDDPGRRRDASPGRRAQRGRAGGERRRDRARGRVPQPARDQPARPEPDRGRGAARRARRLRARRPGRAGRSSGCGRGSAGARSRSTSRRRPVEVDPVFLDEAFTNVLENALKYTRGRHGDPGLGARGRWRRRPADDRGRRRGRARRRAPAAVREVLPRARRPADRARHRDRPGGGPRPGRGDGRPGRRPAQRARAAWPSTSTCRRRGCPRRSRPRPRREPRSPGPAGSPTVLVVEDDDETRRVLVRELGARGYGSTRRPTAARRWSTGSGTGRTSSCSTWACPTSTASGHPPDPARGDDADRDPVGPVRGAREGRGARARRRRLRDEAVRRGRAQRTAPRRAPPCRRAGADGRAVSGRAAGARHPGPRGPRRRRAGRAHAARVRDPAGPAHQRRPARDQGPAAARGLGRGVPGRGQLRLRPRQPAAPQAGGGRSDGACAT